MQLRLPAELLKLASQVAHDLLREIEGARAVVVATEDGFDIAQAMAEPLDAARIAAMTSSITAIGQAISDETALGEPNCLVVDASGGFLIMRRARCAAAVLVINALTTRQALLGMAMHNVASASKRLEAGA